MARYNQFAALVARVVLDFLLLIPLMVFWVSSLRSATHHAQPTKLAQKFLKAAGPVFTLGVILLVTAEIMSIVQRYTNTSSAYYLTFIYSGIYVSLTTSLFLTVGEILILAALHVTTLAVLYVALGKAKAWRLLRIDVLVSVAILIIFAIALFVKDVVMYSTHANALTGQQWLPLIINAILLVLAVGIFAVAIYALSALKKRDARSLGNIPTLLLVASTLWLFHCTYSFARNIQILFFPGGPVPDVRARPFLYTFLFLYPAAAVLALLTVIVRRPVWSGSVIGTKDQDEATLRPSNENHAQGF
ncbi:hypothetical protein B0H67DRAFT_578078 [Lasiosphaeris hirsuta]|uniref:Uncharacterized protein n=1 Tax=Lasiosphaeris hirsuta TaxID=260670 RepID=A0AA40ASD5_9PEZI|nr:hypothetical protein B0H67DRAFT_578078 [Lasiosphaeris hirsuta]